MIGKYFLIFLIGCIVNVQSAIITTVDFVRQPTYTGTSVWGNYFGVTLNLDEVIGSINNTVFQGYFENSNLRNSFGNNWATMLRMPKGWFYNCTIANTTQNNVTCAKQLEGNATFFSQLGEFVWNTCGQPYWTFSINNERLNLFNSTLKGKLNKFFLDIYTATHRVIFHIEMMRQADAAEANGMRVGNYTINNFLDEAYQYETILYRVYYRGPGITEDADPSWLQNYRNYFMKVNYGIFSFECIVFHDPTLVTIENLLSDNYTKGYLQRRFYVNSTFSYSSFSQSTSITNLKLMNGNGIDGVTNTMAAAIWFIDFGLESVLYKLYDIHLDGSIYSGNHQGFLGVAPGYQPSSLYYAMVFCSLMGDDQPQIILPSVQSGSSSRIKVWGLETTLKMKFVILNKDTNTSLNGKVKIQVKSNSQEKLRCIYLSAPSLNSKSNDMTFGGYKYIAGDPHPSGVFNEVEYVFDDTEGSYFVHIKYAEACVCEMTNADKIIPSIDTCNSELFIQTSILLFLLILFMNM